MKNTHHRSRDIVPFEGGLKNFLGDFWSFPTIFDSPHWDRPASYLPDMDISENENQFEVLADLPGFDPADISVEVESDGLVIQGKQEKKEEEKDKNYLRLERQTGSFYRKVNFPPSADLQNLHCRSKNGVLSITIPKRKEAQKKSFKIHTE